MGTFASLFRENGVRIPENKKQEFTERIERLYQAGGMMEVERVELCDKKIILLRKARMKDDGMEFFYNYFEDVFWENAGFASDKCRVWSSKIGWDCFSETVIAAYTLEELYSDGVTATFVNGRAVTSWAFVGWINYLFDEEFHVKNFDPWELFEAFHYSDEERYEDVNWFGFGMKRYGFIGSCEIYAVLNGTEQALEHFKEVEMGAIEHLAIEGMEYLLHRLDDFINDTTIDKDNQLKMLMETIRAYYKRGGNKTALSNTVNEKLINLIKGLDVSDAPAFLFKAIAERYRKDFWDLWGVIRDDVKRINTSLYGNEGCSIVPISTVDFFNLSPDDMIYYWEKDNQIDFSEELYNWFKELKEQFDILVNSDFSITSPLEYILHLAQEADDYYYHIYVFSEFFQETLENLGDKRYQSLWKLYDRMIHNPALRKAGEVIYVPEDSEYKHLGVCYTERRSKRRLWTTWDMMQSDRKNNKARVTLRRYMALVANRTLRCNVFGF